MKRIVLLLTFLAASGCWLTKPTPITPPPTPDGGYADATAGQIFVDCSKDVEHQALLGVLPAIETALALQDYEVELAKLVGKYGLAEIACGVAWVVNKANGMAMTTNDALEADKEQRGSTWLAAQRVKVAGAAQ